MEDGRSGGNHRAHVRLPDTQQRETNASVKTHNTVTQTRKQYSAQHNEIHVFFTIDSFTVEHVGQLLTLHCATPSLRNAMSSVPTCISLCYADSKTL